MPRSGCGSHLANKPAADGSIAVPRWLCPYVVCPAPGRAVRGPIVPAEGCTLEAIRCLSCGRLGVLSSRALEPGDGSSGEDEGSWLTRGEVRGPGKGSG